MILDCICHGWSWCWSFSNYTITLDLYLNEVKYWTIEFLLISCLLIKDNKISIVSEQFINWIQFTGKFCDEKAVDVMTSELFSSCCCCGSSKFISMLIISFIMTYFLIPVPVWIHCFFGKVSIIYLSKYLNGL